MWIPVDEYDKIKKSFPIPCVDLIVMNEMGELLLVKRKNEPAKNEWWFPGGRVMFGETREDAAIRKLKEECGIIGNNPIEWKTFDIFLEDVDEKYLSHGISSFFIFSVSEKIISLDYQSTDYLWIAFKKLESIRLHDFIKKVLLDYQK